jgi:glycyl-radical enzyme activating protein
LITDIKRFAVHDGDGIRTTVFFKGCPLRCLWCHNPECLSFGKELGFFAHKCIGCGRCAEVCPNGVHTFQNGIHLVNRAKCVKCGRCAEACPADALVVYGKDLSAEEIMAVVRKDKPFYDETGGGMTVSGGECLSQPDFCAELLQMAKAEGIGTAVDTSGYAEKEVIDRILNCNPKVRQYDILNNEWGVFYAKRDTE